MRNTQKLLITTLLTTGFLHLPLSADLLVYEGFSGYNTGALNGQGTTGTGLTGNWGGNTGVNVNFTDTGLTFGNLVTSRWRGYFQHRRESHCHRGRANGPALLRDRNLVFFDAVQFQLLGREFNLPLQYACGHESIFEQRRQPAFVNVCQESEYNFVQTRSGLQFGKHFDGRTNLGCGHHLYGHQHL